MEQRLTLFKNTHIQPFMTTCRSTYISW